MKKGVLLLTFLVSLTAAQAQVGIRAGFGSSNFSNGDVQRAFNAIVTPHLGAYFAIKATEKLTVEPGLFYTGKGFSTVSPVTTKEFKESLSYLDIPVLARYAVTPSFTLFLGPQAGFLLGRTYTEESKKITDTTPIGGYEIGGVLGVGYQLTSGVNFQASYDFGIAPFKYFEADVNNTVFKLSIGYTLPSNLSKEKTE